MAPEGAVSSSAMIELCGERMSWVKSWMICSRWAAAAFRSEMSVSRTIHAASAPDDVR